MIKSPRSILLSGLIVAGLAGCAQTRDGQVDGAPTGFLSEAPTLFSERSATIDAGAIETSAIPRPTRSDAAPTRATAAAQAAEADAADAGATPPMVDARPAFDDWSAAASALATGEAPTSIDPTYRVGRGEPATQGDPAMAAYIRRAAEIAMENGHVYGAAVHLSRLYDEDPTDKQVVYDLSRHMRYIGAFSEAEQVLRDGLARHAHDPLLRLELAKTYVASGRPEQARPVLIALRQERPQDPAILQTLGVALDRAGEHAAAQRVYAEALDLGRPSAALLSNAGMSHLLSGDLDRAEQLLRAASIAPGASAQIRQNLALALTLKGQVDEARRVSQAAIPRERADRAIASYQSVADAGHAWTRAVAD